VCIVMLFYIVIVILLLKLKYIDVKKKQIR